MAIFTRHAKRRLRTRHIARGSASAASFGEKKYLGNHKYKATRRGVTIVYKKSGSKRIVLTSYRSAPKR